MSDGWQCSWCRGCGCQHRGRASVEKPGYAGPYQDQKSKTQEELDRDGWSGPFLSIWAVGDNLISHNRSIIVPYTPVAQNCHECCRSASCCKGNTDAPRFSVLLILSRRLSGSQTSPDSLPVKRLHRHTLERTTAGSACSPAQNGTNPEPSSPGNLGIGPTMLQSAL